MSPVPSASRPPYVDEAEGRAESLRDELGLGSDAIADLFELLGHLGLGVVRWPMGEAGPDGFYIIRKDFALAVINSTKRVERQRFTAAHELAHHLFDHQSAVDRDIFNTRNVPERRANAFAAFFLLPRAGVRRWLLRGGWKGDGPLALDAASVVHLAHHFGLSYEASLYQLRDLGWLRTRDLEDLKAVPPERIARRLGYDLEAAQAERNRRVLPSEFVRRALAAYENGDISLSRFAELLRTDEEEANQVAREAGVSPAQPALDDLLEDARRA